MKPPPAYPCPPPRKWSLFTLAFLTVSLASGLVYGWPALRRNLQLGGSTLSEQTLGGIFTAGAWSTQGGRFLFGLARDKYGTKRTTLVSLLCVIGGSLGVAWSDPNGAAQLGASLFLIGLGSGSQLCLQPVAGLFSKSGTIIASLSGAFQISGLVFLALTTITEVRAHSFTGFAVVIAALAIVSAIMLPRGSSFVLPVDTQSEVSVNDAGDAVIDENEIAIHETPAENKADADADKDTDTEQQEAATQDTEQQEAATPTPTPTQDAPPKQKQSLRKRLCELLFRMEYMALLAWFSVCIIPLQYYVGSIGFQLEEKGDDDGYYTNLFSIVYASAAALAPFGGYLADVLGLGITQGLATSLSSVSFFILASNASLNVQAIGLAAYAVGRMLVFGMFFSNVAKRFGYANYGLLAGLGLLISALFSLIQYPLIALAADGKARHVNVACGAALVAVLPYCIWLGFRERQGKSPLDVENERVIERTDTGDAAGMDNFEDSEVQELGTPNQRQARRQTFMASFLRKPSYFAQ